MSSILRWLIRNNAVVAKERKKQPEKLSRGRKLLHRYTSKILEEANRVRTFALLTELLSNFAKVENNRVVSCLSTDWQ